MILKEYTVFPEKLYFSIHWWPKEFLKAERPLVYEINRVPGR